MGSSRAPDAFTRLLRTYFTHSQGGFPAGCRICSLCTKSSPRVPTAPLPPGTLDAAAPDGFMGVPPVPEASGQRWGPVLFALFLAASRGKVDPAWALGQSTRRTQRAGWGGVIGRKGHPGSPLQQGGCWDRLAGCSSVSAKCPGWMVGTVLCSDRCPSRCLSIPSLPRAHRARVASAEQEMEVVGTAPLCFSGCHWRLTPMASPCPSCLRVLGSHRLKVLCPVPW